jgi:putative tricarboxylic transport membrane protein
MTENQLRTALAAGQGNPAVLVESPMSIVFLTVSFLFLFVPFLIKHLRAVA